MVFNTTFNNIVIISCLDFIVGGNRSTFTRENYNLICNFFLNDGNLFNLVPLIGYSYFYLPGIYLRKNTKMIFLCFVFQWQVG